MKKIIYSIIILFAFACKPESTTPEDPMAKDCQIQKVAYEDGSNYVYKFSEANQLTEILYSWKDEEGKPLNLTIKFEYNAAGNLVKVVNSEGYIDDYIYDNSGALTRIDFKSPEGNVDEQFVVKTDAQKRISSYLTARDRFYVTYEYNGPGGVFSKSTVKSGNFIVDQYEVKTYEIDKSKKNPNIIIKGHPFDPKLFTDELIYSIPLNLQPANLIVGTAQATTNYDENWENFMPTTRLSWDVANKYTYNENGFITKQESENKLEKAMFVTTYNYSNCN